MEKRHCARSKAWRPDYVFLDINSPRLDGYEVARRLRAQFTAGELKLVMISGVTLDAATTCVAMVYNGTTAAAQPIISVAMCQPRSG